MSPSYSVPLTMEGTPQNGPVPVKVNSDAPVAAEKTAMLLPSPTATTPPEAPVTPPSTKPSVKQCCQMKAPVDGFTAFREPVQLVVASPPMYSVVPSNAEVPTSPVPTEGSSPPPAIRSCQTGPDASAPRSNA